MTDPTPTPTGTTEAKCYTVHRRYMHFYVMCGGEMIEKFAWEEDAVKLAEKLNEAATKPWVKT